MKQIIALFISFSFFVQHVMSKQKDEWSHSMDDELFYGLDTAIPFHI
jgi:hypothetical protein